MKETYTHRNHWIKSSILEINLKILTKLGFLEKKRKNLLILRVSNNTKSGLLYPTTISEVSCTRSLFRKRKDFQISKTGPVRVLGGPVCPQGGSVLFILGQTGSFYFGLLRFACDPGSSGVWQGGPVRGRGGPVRLFDFLVPLWLLITFVPGFRLRCRFFLCAREWDVFNFSLGTSSEFRVEITLLPLRLFLLSFLILPVSFFRFLTSNTCKITTKYQKLGVLIRISQ